MTQNATCGGCAATWTGSRPCHCSGCHQTFAGVTLFDAHRGHHGERGRCLDPATLPVMHLRDGIWSGPEMTEEQKLARFGTK